VFAPVFFAIDDFVGDKLFLLGDSGATVTWECSVVVVVTSTCSDLVSNPTGAKFSLRGLSGLSGALRGRPSRMVGLAGSYWNFSSREKMLLFLTREAFLRFSIEPRLVGEGEAFENGLPFPLLPRTGDVGSRPCQKSRGELAVWLVLKGEDSKGEDSPLLNMLLCGRVSMSGCV
jgi:hypothetical protein